jgi:hypothetical protein
MAKRRSITPGIKRERQEELGLETDKQQKLQEAAPIK